MNVFTKKRPAFWEAGLLNQFGLYQTPPPNAAGIIITTTITIVTVARVIILLYMQLYKACRLLTEYTAYGQNSKELF
jgi:hypothetical protein